MLTLFGKKRINVNKVSNILANTIIEYVENGFPQLIEIINLGPEFETCPEIKVEDDKEFLLILLVGNLNFVPIYFDADIAEQITCLVKQKFATALETDLQTLDSTLKEYKSFMVLKNHPSKNMLYAMSKGMFYKYQLNCHQEDFFRTQNTPNPIFLKRLDEIMHQFIFNWDEFIAKYKVVL